MADTGDGGNSSYAVAKLLAQPTLKVLVDGKARGNVLLIGGDLTYPNPSAVTPFKYALQPPHWYKNDSIVVDKPQLHEGVKDLKDYDGPKCFLIPGNHDWFDGLITFMRYICHKSGLGGWLMPQKNSYFALPKGWWVFGLDLALLGEIDVDQFKFFSELVKEKVKDDDAVIVITHEPGWLLDLVNVKEIQVYSHTR